MPFVFKDFMAVAYPDERLISQLGLLATLKRGKPVLVTKETIMQHGINRV